MNTETMQLLSALLALFAAGGTLVLLVARLFAGRSRSATGRNATTKFAALRDRPADNRATSRTNVPPAANKANRADNSCMVSVFIHPQSVVSLSHAVAGW
ncbi:MAG: hypothetical protein ACKOYL_02105, partial [Actinomycetota bacterium]